LETLQDNRLERANGIDLLNCQDIKGRCPLTLAFKYGSMDVASVLLHFGADHHTNQDVRNEKGRYVKDALKGKFFGLNNVSESEEGLAHRQVE